MFKMRPLILLIVVAVVHGKPGILESPTPTPSAPPAIIANLATPTPSVASLQFGANADSGIVEPVVNIGGHLQGAKLANEPLPPYASGWNLGFNQPGLGLAQQGLSFPQPGLTLPQSSYSYGPPALPYIQPGFNFGQSELNFNQPALNFLPLGSGLPSPQLNLAPVGPTISPILGSTIGPSIGPSLAANIGPTFAPPVSPTIAPVISSTFGSVSSTLAPPISVTSASINLNSGLSFSSSAGEVSGPSLVHKHVYVYVAPEQPEEIIPRKPIQFPPPQTHYRIIFIRAPTPPKPTVPVIPPPPQDEEKTIVYVLAKRPEDAPEIKIPVPPPTQPAKPEVYFIRYNALNEGGGTALNDRPPVDIDLRGGPPPVSVNNAGLGGIAQDLNTASLSGGSALSNAIQSSPEANLVQISTTPIPKYGPPSYEKK